MRKIFYMLFCIILFSCSDLDNNRNVIICENTSTSKLEDIILLYENIKYAAGTVNDLEVINDSLFIVSYDNMVSIYNNRGYQIKTIGSKGRAKGEYISAGALYVDDDRLYVQCRQSLKIIAYDYKTGNVVDEYKNIGKNARDFVVMNNHIYLYGNGDLSYIKVYDISSRKIVSSYGKYNDVDELLFFNSLTRGISCSEEDVIFVTPSSFSIYKADVNSDNLICTIRHSAYTIDDNVNAKEMMRPPYDKAIDYTNENSTTLAISNCNDDIYYVATENKDLSSKNKFIKKSIAVYGVDVKSNSACCTMIPYPADATISRYCLYENTLYYIANNFNGKRYISKTIVP